MSLPVPGRELPTSGVRSYLFQRSPKHLHRGIDIPAPLGTPVAAVAPGKVVRSANAWAPGFTGYGRHVVVHHPDRGVWTLYAHLNEATAKVGDQVAAGDQVGTVGITKFSKSGGYVDTFGASGAHLHFEVSPKSYPQMSEAPRLDPVAFLKGLEEAANNATGRRPAPRRKATRPNALIATAAVCAALFWIRKHKR